MVECKTQAQVDVLKGHDNPQVMKFKTYYNKPLNRICESIIYDDDDLTNEELANRFIKFDTFEWFFYAINELGEKGGPLKYLKPRSGNDYEIKFNIGSNKIPIYYMFIARISNDLLQVIFHPEGDDTFKITDNLKRGESFSLIGYLSQCMFDMFRLNKKIKRVVFFADNKKLEQLHNTMTKWIPKKYKELKFNRKENGNKPSYWYDKIQLTKEDFRYITKDTFKGKVNG